MSLCRALGLAAVVACACSSPEETCATCTPSITSCGAAGASQTPLSYGACRLAAAQQAAGDHTVVTLLTRADPSAASYVADLDPRPESFVITPQGSGLAVVGSDAVGAMYGALELAETLEAGRPIAGYAANEHPTTSLRGANFFITLPDAGESDWWFIDASFWQRYLDQMARARMNLLDLHGMYNLANTVFPNLLLYFASSQTYPDLGVAPAERARNLAMLKTVVAMAAARGIRVDLMTYRSDLDPTGGGPSSVNDLRLATYIREAAEDLARELPDLYSLGFRIGESTHPASFYVDSFIAGVRAASAELPISTRTWITSKPEVLTLARAASGRLLVETKYNGEQLGPPYIVADAPKPTMHGFPSYFYEDYLERPTPYTFIFQIWASGTHRFFSHASYASVQRIARTLAFSPHVSGFTLQPSHAYLPQRDFWHAVSADSFSPWTFERDDLEYVLFGRLAYDPNTPEQVFRDLLRERTGTDALWEPLQAASTIVPWIQTTSACGMDSRDVAVELEWIGDLRYWASPASAPSGTGSCKTTGYHGPLDAFAIAGPAEAAADLANGVPTSRLRPQDVAALLLDAAARARKAAPLTGDMNARARDVARACVALADLGEYVAHKLRGAAALAVYERTASADYIDRAHAEVSASTAAWVALANDTTYVAPFQERLRMAGLGLSPFHWREETPDAQTDAASVNAVAAQIAASPPVFTGTVPPSSSWLDAARAAGPGLASIDISPKDAAAASWTVTAVLASAPPVGAQVRILSRPFPAPSTWQAFTAAGSGTTYTAEVPGTGVGALFAVEVSASTGAWRFPDPVDATPYVVLAPP